MTVRSSVEYFDCGPASGSCRSSGHRNSVTASGIVPHSYSYWTPASPPCHLPPGTTRGAGVCADSGPSGSNRGLLRASVPPAGSSVASRVRPPAGASRRGRVESVEPPEEQWRHPWCPSHSREMRVRVTVEQSINRQPLYQIRWRRGAGRPAEFAGDVPVRSRRRRCRLARVRPRREPSGTTRLHGGPPRSSCTAATGKRGRRSAGGSRPPRRAVSAPR